MLSHSTRRGNGILHQLPGGQPRALEIGACLVGEHVDIMAALHGRANDAKRCAVAAGGQGSRVAVSQDGALLRQQVCAVRAERFALGDVLVVQPLGEFDDRRLDLGDRRVLRGELVEQIPHLPDPPEEVDGGRPSLRQRGADDLDFGGELGQRRLRCCVRYRSPRPWRPTRQ